MTNPPTPDEIAACQFWLNKGMLPDMTPAEAVVAWGRLLAAYVAQREEIERLTTELSEHKALLNVCEAEALERAATIADAHDEAPAPGTIDTGAIWRGASARMIAAAIRALKPEEKETTG